MPGEDPVMRVFVPQAPTPAGVQVAASAFVDLNKLPNLFVVARENPEVQEKLFRHMGALCVAAAAVFEEAAHLVALDDPPQVGRGAPTRARTG